MKKQNKILAVATIGLIVTTEAFIGAVDWLNVFDLPKDHIIRVTAKPLALGQQTKGNLRSFCNYVSVGKKRVLSNAHCIVNNDASNIELFFTDYDKNPVICDKVLAISPYGSGLDYLLLECQDEIPTGVSFDTSPLKVDDKLLHISHNCNYYKVGGNPNCKRQPKYDNSQDCRVFALNDNGDQRDFTQGCDSLGGSSGSVVHSRNLNEHGVHPVVGLHHTGTFYADSRGSLEGKGLHNGVVKIGLVLDDLKSKGFDITAPPKDKEIIETLPIKEDRPSFFRALWLLIKTYL